MKIEKHPLTKAYGLKFSIVLTNSRIRDPVLQYLALKLSNCVSTKATCTVELVPTDRVRLHWSKENPIYPEYSIDKTWHTNTNLQDPIDFIIGCATEMTCQQLRNDVEGASETFVKGLQLEYMTTGAEMPSKTIQVNSSYIRSHARYTMYKQLVEQSASAIQGQIHVNTNDRNELLTSIARDSLAQQTEDEDYQADDADSQIDLVKLLSDMLISEQVTLKSHMDEAWKSLYWHENNQRPDKVVKTLEKILTNLKEKNHTKSCNRTHAHTSHDSELGMSFKIPVELLQLLAAAGKKKRSVPSGYNDEVHESRDTTPKTKKEKRTRITTIGNDVGDDVNANHSREKRISFGFRDESHEETDTKASYCPDDLLETYKKNAKYVEWSGNSFKVKPMTVYRLNVGNYSDIAAMTIKKVKIKLRKNVHSVALRSSTTVVANTSSKDLIPNAFGTLWILTNLTELQRQFDEWKLKLQNELLPKYNELSLRHNTLNESLLAALNRTEKTFRKKLDFNWDRIKNISNTTSYLKFTLRELHSGLISFVNNYTKTIIKQNCWRRAKFEMKHVTRYCDDL